MQLYLVLLLISYLLTPIGAAILGRCKVAKRLHDGGLNYFEGYSLENWVCLAYFESKFNPSAVYENLQDGSTGFGLFQIRDSEWCGHGKNLCRVSCTALLNPNLKETIKCAKKIVKGKQGMGAWPVWTKNCQLSDILARWLDGCNLFILKNYDIQYFSMRDIDRLGIQKVMEQTCDRLIGKTQRPIHLSFDIDAFDPKLAPATGTPVVGGLTYREGVYITEEIHNTGLLSALDLVEVNPHLATSEEEAKATASLAVDVIASSFGQTREGGHIAYDHLPTPSSPHESENEECVRI